MKNKIDCDKIQAALEHEPRVNMYKNTIRVECVDGVAHLKGEVDSIIAKRLAVYIAKSVEGVEGVDDELKVTPAQRVGDEAMVDAVVKALMNEPAFRDYAVRKHTHHSEQIQERTIMVFGQEAIVRLVGSVESLAHKRLADVLAWWTPGVADVDNRLRVSPQQQDTDDEVQDSLRLVLEKDPSLNQDEIRVETQNHVVHLHGVVHNETERELAEKDAWCILGVHDVRNDLQVRP